MLSILKLGARAYGVPIRQTVAELTGRDVAIGAVYTTLDRLQQKGYVSSWRGEPTAERGGRAKRYFRVEAAGERALGEAERARAALRGWLQPALAAEGI